MTHKQSQTPTLPLLREDLAIHPGPVARDGSPSWVLQDPGRNRFFHLDRQAFEILSRWSLGSPEKIVEQVKAEVLQTITLDDVADVVRFLMLHELVQVRGEQARDLLEQRSRKQHWLKRVLRGYLFPYPSRQS